jgi:ubiquinone/menaquinone biosynthesis C-methylase UbiE
MEDSMSLDIKVSDSLTKEPQPYMIAVGEADDKRLDALGAMFNDVSINWLKSNNTLKQFTMLDVGCGNGKLTRLFAKIFPDSTFVGVDISSEQVELSQRAANEEKLTNTTWRICDVLKLDDLKSKNPKLFDIVHCRFVLTHLPNPEKAVDQMLSMVRPGGLLLVEEFGERFEIAYPSTPIKAIEAWKKMIEFQRKMQQSHKDTAERVSKHLSTSAEVSSFNSKFFDISIEGKYKKSMFRMGAEQGVKKIQEMKMPQLIKEFGYNSGKEWLEEFRAFETNDSIRLQRKNFECIVAIKNNDPLNASNVY